MTKGVTYLHAGAGGPRCRLGAVMTDVAGETYMLSARYILERSVDGKIHAESGAVIGTYVPDGLALLDESSVAHPYHELIGRVSLAETAELPEGLLASCNRGPLDTHLPPGSTLIWESPADGPVEFTIVGRGGEVGFTNPLDGRTSYHSDPVVLELSDSGVVGRPGNGDAGSLLCDASGVAAALLLSSDGQRYYAASLAAYAARFQLHPFTEQPLLPPPSRTEPMSMPAAVAEAREAVSHIQMAVAAKPPVHPDPDGENIPQHLVRQLEEVDA